MKRFVPNGETLRKFMQSKARVKVIQGPIGCLSCDTEFLTPTGWIPISQYEKGDQVAEWCPGSGVITFREPKSYIDLPCDEMWWFRNDHNMSMFLSDEHRVPVYDYEGRFAVKTAACLARRPSKNTIPVSFFAPTEGTLPYTDAQIQLRVAIAADGCLPKRGNQIVICVRKERKKVRLRQLLTEAGVEWKELTRVGRPTELTFAFSRDGWSKGFGPEWWGASRHQLEIVVEECLLWDGLANHEEDRFFSTLRDEADFIQFAAHATGRRASISIREEENEEWSTYYTVHITKPGSQKARVGLRGDHTIIERMPAPGGRKYCFETQTGFFIARHADRIFVTGNSGKSLACAMSVYMKALEQVKQRDGIRRCRAHVFRDTYSRLEDTTLKTWLEWFKEEEFGRFYWSKPMVHEIRTADLELDVHFVALEDERAASYFRSLETTICWFNEVQYMDRLLFDEAVSRVGRYPRMIDGGPVGPQVIADMNAPDETHWIPIMRGDVAAPDWFTEEQRQAHKLPKGWEFYVQPQGLLEIKDGEGEITGYEPNPLAENTRYLEPGYYTEVIKGKTKTWIDANALNRVSARRGGKPVLPDFNRAVHVSKKPIEPVQGVELIIGCDFARRPCAIICQNIRGCWYVIGELIARNMGANKFAPLLRNELAQKYPGFKFKIWGDPSGDFKGQNDDDTPFRILRAHHLPVMPAPSNLLTLRIQAAEAVLTRMHEGRPALLVSSACSTLVAALDGGYHFRRMKVAGERYSDEPEKDEYSDPADAWMYALLGAGEGRMLLTGSAAPAKTTQTKRPYNPFKQPAGLRKW